MCLQSRATWNCEKQNSSVAKDLPIFQGGLHFYFLEPQGVLSIDQWKD